MIAVKDGCAYTIRRFEIGAFKKAGYDIIDEDELKTTDAELDKIADIITAKVMKRVEKQVESRVLKTFERVVKEDCEAKWQKDSESRIRQLFEITMNDVARKQLKDSGFRKELICTSSQMIAEGILKSKASQTRIANVLINLLTESEVINE